MVEWNYLKLIYCQKHLGFFIPITQISQCYFSLHLIFKKYNRWFSFKFTQNAQQWTKVETSFILIGQVIYIKNHHYSVKELYILKNILLEVTTTVSVTLCPPIWTCGVVQLNLNSMELTVPVHLIHQASTYPQACSARKWIQDGSGLWQ